MFCIFIDRCLLVPRTAGLERVIYTLGVMYMLLNTEWSVATGSLWIIVTVTDISDCSCYHKGRKVASYSQSGPGLLLFRGAPRIK